MADFALTTDDDLDFSTKDLQVLDGIQAIAQHIRIRLRFFLGEWFLDTRIGVPYYREILVKVPNENIVRETLRKVILGTPGIARLDSFEFTFGEAERQTRKLVVSFLAITTDGEQLEFNEPLIV